MVDRPVGWRLLHRLTPVAPDDWVYGLLPSSRPVNAGPMAGAHGPIGPGSRVAPSGPAQSVPQGALWGQQPPPPSAPKGPNLAPNAWPTLQAAAAAVDKGGGGKAKMGPGVGDSDPGGSSGAGGVGARSANMGHGADALFGPAAACTWGPAPAGSHPISPGQQGAGSGGNRFGPPPPLAVPSPVVSHGPSPLPSPAPMHDMLQHQEAQAGPMPLVDFAQRPGMAVAVQSPAVQPQAVQSPAVQPQAAPMHGFQMQGALQGPMPGGPGFVQPSTGMPPPPVSPSSFYVPVGMQRPSLYSMPLPGMQPHRPPPAGFSPNAFFVGPLGHLHGAPMQTWPPQMQDPHHDQQPQQQPAPPPRLGPAPLPLVSHKNSCDDDCASSCCLLGSVACSARCHSALLLLPCLFSREMFMSQ